MHLLHEIKQRRKNCRQHFICGQVIYNAGVACLLAEGRLWLIYLLKLAICSYILLINLSSFFILF